MHLAWLKAVETRLLHSTCQGWHSEESTGYTQRAFGRCGSGSGSVQLYTRCTHRITNFLQITRSDEVDYYYQNLSEEEITPVYMRNTSHREMKRNNHETATQQRSKGHRYSFAVPVSGAGNVLSMNPEHPLVCARSLFYITDSKCCGTASTFNDFRCPECFHSLR